MLCVHTCMPCMHACMPCVHACMLCVHACMPCVHACVPCMHACMLCVHACVCQLTYSLSVSTRISMPSTEPQTTRQARTIMTISALPRTRLNFSMPTGFTSRISFHRNRFFNCCDLLLIRLGEEIITAVVLLCQYILDLMNICYIYRKDVCVTVY